MNTNPMLCKIQSKYYQKIDITGHIPLCVHDGKLRGYHKVREYEKCRPTIRNVEKQFGQLLRLAGKLPDHRYRFADLHTFREFGEAVWVMPRGRLVKIITKNNT